jgi:hypothetical protein
MHQVFEQAAKDFAQTIIDHIKTLSIDQLMELMGDKPAKRRGRPAKAKSKRGKKATKGKRGRPPGSKNKPKK